MGEYRNLWWTLIAILTVTFAILGVSGGEVYRKAPPIPAQTVTASGEVLMTRDDIMAGQAAWQSTGGVQLGSIWGHGAYQAPDWSAEWLYRELTAWLALAAAATYGTAFDDFGVEQKAALTHMLGAGVFGFMINTPVALFYLQGLNTAAVHAHAALFGVYGFLALGFTLLVLRYIRPEISFNARLMRAGFWRLNAGLALMIFTSLLPVGLFQFEASVTTGMRYARSDKFLQQGFLESLRWFRTFGDVVFILGAIAVAWQVVILGLWRKEAR
ncbi:cbb3-type cytochrome c oxidase subunit I [Sphingopyxis flava]|nr:cbb3-type cytochrome c oxidase subunit I [Sphingopyxis flava]